MGPDRQARQPGAARPETALGAARPGRPRRPGDPPAPLAALGRALALLPDSALHVGYFEVPGDRLATPLRQQEPGGSPTGESRDHR
jgi:hypothetical protein